MEMILELQHGLQLYDFLVKLIFDDNLKLFFQNLLFVNDEFKVVWMVFEHYMIY